MSRFQLQLAADALRRGGVIAYPTEAVWGLGCDPLQSQAVDRLLALKTRPLHKGLILVAADMSQLAPYLRRLSPQQWQTLEQSWPGPVTWLVPQGPDTPDWLTGGRDTLALRVSDHPLVQSLCRQFGGPVVSTSANPSGFAPARSPLQLRHYFSTELDYILHGALGGRQQPSEIRDLRSGKVIRPA